MQDQGVTRYFIVWNEAISFQRAMAAQGFETGLRDHRFGKERWSVSFWLARNPN